MFIDTEIGNITAGQQKKAFLLFFYTKITETETEHLFKNFLSFSFIKPVNPQNYVTKLNTSHIEVSKQREVSVPYTHFPTNYITILRVLHYVNYQEVF